MDNIWTMLGRRPMQVQVMPAAQPGYLKWFVVVGMMHLTRAIAADHAWLTLNATTIKIYMCVGSRVHLLTLVRRKWMSLAMLAHSSCMTIETVALIGPGEMLATGARPLHPSTVTHVYVECHVEYY